MNQLVNYFRPILPLLAAYAALIIILSALKLFGASEQVRDNVLMVGFYCTVLGGFVLWAFHMRRRYPNETWNERFKRVLPF